jgi:hypothetical protein
MKYITRYWLIAVLVSFACFYLSYETTNSPAFVSFEAALDSSQTHSDDDLEDVFDICWTNSTNFWPSKKWSLSLKHGLCFSSIPDKGAKVDLLPDVTFDEIIGISSFADVGASSKCWNWDSKLTGSLSNETEIFSSNGHLSTLCKKNKPDKNFTSIISADLQCNDFHKYISQYSNANKASIAGCFFSSLAGFCAIIGAFLSCREDKRADVYAEEVWGHCDSTRFHNYAIIACGLSFLLSFFTQIAVLSFALAGRQSNPYFKQNNNQMFACLPGYLNQNLGSYKEFNSLGIILNGVSLSLNALMAIVFIVNIYRETSATIDPINDIKLHGRYERYDRYDTIR